MTNITQQQYIKQCKSGNIDVEVLQFCTFRQECDYVVCVRQSMPLGISAFSGGIKVRNSVRSVKVWWERVPKAGCRLAESS